MRRWGWRRGVVAVLMLLGALARGEDGGATAAVRPLEALRDATLKLGLKVPSGWKRGADAAVPLTVVSPEHPALSIKVARLTPSRTVTPAEVVEASVAQYQRIWKVESREARMVDGFPAEQVVLVQSLGSVEARIRKLFVGRGEREVLIVSFSAPSAEFSAWSATFDAVQASLVLR